MMVRSMFSRLSHSLITTGDRDCSISNFLVKEYIMFGLLGETEMTTGLSIFSVLIIDLVVLMVAVAVNAITFTCSGMILRTSFTCENSRRKLFPLYIGFQQFY